MADEEEALLREAFGIAGDVPEGLRERMGEAVLVVAKGDGGLSNVEMAWFLGMMEARGASDEALQRLQTFDTRGVTLAEVLDGDVRPWAPHVVHDAVRVARADGISPFERALAEDAASVLGLPPTFVPALERVMDLDDQVQARRERLLWPGRAPPSGPKDMHAHVSARLSGLDGLLVPDLALRVAQATLVVAAADGAVSDAERAWFQALQRVQGHEAVAHALDRFDPRRARLEDLLPGLRPYARLVLYDALRVARVDGLGAPEREAARAAATRLGLDPALVDDMEKHLALADDLRRARDALLRN